MTPEDFDSWMIAGENSPAYARFCSLVYNETGCQYNMVAPDQRNALLSTLSFFSPETIMDAGCGTGWMSRWLSRKTGAKVIGIDTATAALNIGKKQIVEGEDVTLVYGDITQPVFAAQTFDAVVCVDSLHIQLFKDLTLPVRNLATMVKPGGVMGIFFNALVTDDKDNENGTPNGENTVNKQIHRLEGEHTDLAATLRMLQLPYTFKDLRESDRIFWESCRTVMKKLKEEFIADGIRDIYDAGWSEAEQALHNIERGRRRRYLYTVTIPN